MEKSTRRNLIKVAAAGGVSAALGLTIRPASEARAVAGPLHEHGKPIGGPLAQAIVSFGQWQQARRSIGYLSTILRTVTSTG